MNTETPGHDTYAALLAARAHHGETYRQAWLAVGGLLANAQPDVVVARDAADMAWWAFEVKPTRFPG